MNLRAAPFRFLSPFRRCLSGVCFALLASASIASAIEPLTVVGNHFQTAAGTPVRFWGANLVAFYPTHAQADAIAANLASREINLVRPHHNLRSSLDWNQISGIPALVTYVNNTRTPHAEAWDRFDYLNAQLRARGIYVVLSLHSTRRFLAGDVDIMTTDDTDRSAWMSAVTGLNAAANNLDLYKALPMLDERAARLMEEFAQQLLTHVNPYTGIAYGQDPQVIYLETMNETSSEYAFIAGNKFPASASYWTTLLQAKWDAYTAAHGVTPNDIYTAGTPAQRQARSDFLQGLDQAYFTRLKAFVRGLGCQAPIEFSNLWRGDRFQKLEESLSDVLEEHDYDDPLVVRAPGDMFSYFARSTPVGKPYVIGELNEGQTDALINANAPYRPMLQLAASAYGAFNDWSGVTWFAWAHGDKLVGNDGWSIAEERRPSVNGDIIGQLESDGMMLDHLRTAGILFKRGLVAPSAGPLTWFADDPLGGNLNYQDMMAPKYPFKAGWQNIHAIKRAFGPVPPAQPTASWMTTDPVNPFVSDTNEIRKDTARQQLTVSAPQAEAFSGKLDSAVPAGLAHLGLGATSGSATVILVSDDGLPLGTSENLVISRTFLDSANAEIASPVTTLTQLKTPAGNAVWHLKRTRPRGETGYEPLVMTNGVLTLPADGWHEAELKYAPAGSLPSRQSTAQAGDLLRPVFDDAYRLAGVFSAGQGGFSLNAQQVIDPSTTFAPAEGTKSVRMKLTAGFDPVVLGYNFTNSAAQPALLDFTGWRSTAGLRFWIYTKRNVPSLAIELASDNAGQTVEVRLPLANYLQPSDYGNKWVEVTVPLADFPDTGLRYDAATGQNTPVAFLWSRVKGVGFYCSTVASGYYDPYFDNLRLVRVGVPGIGPSAPTNVTATAGNAQVVVYWSASPGAAGYHVKRSATTGGPYDIVGSPAGTTYTDTTVINGTTYYYVVSATDASGEGADSAQVAATPQGPPPVPTGLTASAGDGEVNLAWTASAGASGYNVKRATVTGGPYTIIASPASANFPDGTVTNGTTYYYVVSAVNAVGESSTSAEAIATPQGTTGTVTATFVSIAADDGWLQESSQTSNVGGGFNASNATSQALIIGDTNSNRQNKLIVSFDTSSLPASATILSATLKLRRGALIGSNPFATLGSCFVDLKAGAGFGGAPALVASDFQAPADAVQIASMSNPLNNGDWSTGSLSAAGIAAIDRAGTTQLRVYFELGDNGNSSNDYLGFYSGENADASSRPVLEIVYQSAALRAAPAITSASSAAGSYGAPFAYTIVASNDPVTFRATGLPPGLTLDPTTGLISGAPIATGDYAVELEAVNPDGTSTASLALAIAPAPATIVLTNLGQTYDGGAKPVEAVTVPAALAVTLTYNGEPTLPVNAGVYVVNARIADPNYLGAAVGTLTIARAMATVSLGNLHQIYDGAPKRPTVITSPAMLPVSLAYDGATAPPTNAGSHVVAALVDDPNYSGAATGTLTIEKAAATITLQGLGQVYDGTPKAVTATTDPEGLAVTLTYDGGSTPPTLPGAHAVAATLNDANHSGSVTDTLAITITALVRHAPTLNGGLDGSIQVLSGETTILNGGAWVSGDLLVPGTPTVRLNGNVTYGGVVEGPGLATPAGYGVLLNGNTLLRHVVRQVDPIALPFVDAPLAPAGTRSVTLNSAGQSPGDPATLRNLTLNGNVGPVAVPPSSYDAFTANGGSGFIFGVAGDAVPAVYTLQSLTLNGGSSLQIAGPVVLTLAKGVTLNGTLGNEAHPEWLTLRLASGGVTLNGGATLHGYVAAPAGTILINGNSTLRGGVASDGLIINGQGLLEQTGP